MAAASDSEDDTPLSQRKAVGKTVGSSSTALATPPEISDEAIGTAVRTESVSATDRRLDSIINLDTKKWLRKKADCDIDSSSWDILQMARTVATRKPDVNKPIEIHGWKMWMVKRQCFYKKEKQFRSVPQLAEALGILEAVRTTTEPVQTQTGGVDDAAPADNSGLAVSSQTDVHGSSLSEPPKPKAPKRATTAYR